MATGEWRGRRRAQQKIKYQGKQRENVVQNSESYEATFVACTIYHSIKMYYYCSKKGLDNIR